MQVNAQNFPRVATIAWDNNPPEDAVTGYTITFNGTVLGSLTPSSICVSLTNTCSTTVTVPANGTYTFSVFATNFWGSSTPANLTFTARIPGNSGNLRITGVK